MFAKDCLRHDSDLSHLRWTVDTPEDFEVVSGVFRHFHPNPLFAWTDVLTLHEADPSLFEANKAIPRNEGSSLSNGQKLWKRAKKVIPGGNMLLSKRAEMFLPAKWPAYFSRTKGCKVWDLDGNEYVDMSIMGIGTNILGYSHPAIDEAVMHVVKTGNMSTLNCPEEVHLAEKLIELHPWAQMVRLTRSGGEANSVAIRIARAASGRDKVAICGYHGWHDWYLSANLGEARSLDGHLLPGLGTGGVPRNLRGTVFPFAYNCFSELEQIANQHDLGCIIMEVQRSSPPENNFLEKVRNLATQRGIVLIFDECTSGFRQSYGGLHKHYGINPDMAMFGKALGNGYAICAVIGKAEIMEAAQSTFISSTFWTERIGPAAGLAALEAMESMKSWEQITSTGQRIRKELSNLADKFDLNLNQTGLPSLTCYNFESDNALEYKTLITQEMLSKGYLAANSVYVCTEHTPSIVDGFIAALAPVFQLIQECENGRDVNTLLRSPVCHNGFRRLN